MQAGSSPLTVKNDGRLGHTFRIRGTDPRGVRADHDPPRASPGRASTKLAPGTYTMFCALANHEELGMTGKLHVR